MNNIFKSSYLNLNNLNITWLYKYNLNEVLIWISKNRTETWKNGFKTSEISDSYYSNCLKLLKLKTLEFELNNLHDY